MWWHQTPDEEHRNKAGVHIDRDLSMGIVR